MHVDWGVRSHLQSQLYGHNDREDPEKQSGRIPISEVIGHRSGMLGGTEGSNSLLSANESLRTNNKLLLIVTLVGAHSANSAFAVSAPTGSTQHRSENVRMYSESAAIVENLFSSTLNVPHLQICGTAGTAIGRELKLVRYLVSD